MKIDMAYAKAVGDICGASAEAVADVLKMTYEIRSCYHGIRLAQNLADIKRNGIEPLTPDGGICERGFASWWASGRNLFSGDGKTANAGQDSVLFDRAHNNGGISIAVTDFSTLNTIGIKIKRSEPCTRSKYVYGDGQITIAQTVPIDAISLLNISGPIVPAGCGHEVARKYGIAREFAMIGLLQEFLHDYRPGKIIERNIE